MKKIVTNLTTWVILAIVSGALLGHFNPTTAIAMQPLGKYFIEVVKLFINPIIFLRRQRQMCIRDRSFISKLLQHSH